MHSFLHFLFFTLLWALTWLPISTHAQTPVRSDSLVMRDLQANGIAIDSGNDVVLLTSGHEKFEDLFRCLEQARSFIHMEYFNFRKDSINKQLIQLLHRKVQEGVEVRVMYDAFGNSSNNRPIQRAEHDSICALGIQLVKFDPIRFPWLNHIIPRDHRKIVVVDGQTAYTGGMNVADYYINGIEGIGPWRDMHLRIHGPAVNRLHRIFTTMWAKATGEVLDNPRYFPEPQLQSAQRRLAIVDRAPRVSNRSIRQLYVSMLNHATRHVRIINPYFVPTHQVRQAIKNAIARGVDVEILLSEKSDIPLTPDASHYVGYKLSKRGADVQLFQGGFHHTKLMIVDDTFCTIGSSNLDSRSLRCDYEVNVVIFDEEIVGRLNAMFDRDLQTSVPLTRQYWRSKTLWKRMVAWFGNLLTPVL